MAQQISYFSPGPAKIPEEVLRGLQESLVHYKDTHVSVLELSHRSKDFDAILQKAETVIREVLDVPGNYRLLFMQGGGTGQFAAVPLNLISRTGKADYIVTGSWSSKAAKEAAKYGSVNLVLPEGQRYTGVPDRSCWRLDPDASYVYYCANETVEGVEFQSVPEVPSGVPLVCDMSSNYFTRSVDVSKFGLIYGGAQKNIGCAGVTLVIVREDLLGNPLPTCPVVLDYTVMTKHKSLYNTPPTFPIHVLGEVIAWVKKEGGLAEMERRSLEKSRILYSIIEESHGFYSSPVDPGSRSRMNVVFRVGGAAGNEDLEKKFVDAASQLGLLSLKGHRYYFGFCSRELAACVPAPLPRPRNIRQAAVSHDYCVAVGNSRVGRYDNCFFPYASKPWNSLPFHVFPNNYDLTLFKRQVFHFFKNWSVGGIRASLYNALTLADVQRLGQFMKKFQQENKA